MDEDRGEVVVPRLWSDSARLLGARVAYTTSVALVALVLFQGSHSTFLNPVPCPLQHRFGQRLDGMKDSSINRVSLWLLTLMHNTGGTARLVWSAGDHGLPAVIKPWQNEPNTVRYHSGGQSAVFQHVNVNIVW